jgi:hypothetical protein
MRNNNKPAFAKGIMLVFICLYLYKFDEFVEIFEFAFYKIV